MNKPIRRLGIVVLVTAAAISPIARAGSAEPASRHAGPWYTPQELKALVAYGNASFADKTELLAGRTRVDSTGVGRHVRLAGPWYAPQELTRLDAYANARSAQKDVAALRRFRDRSDPRGFDWGDAGVGAGAGVLLGAALAALWSSRLRGQRRLRHT